MAMDFLIEEIRKKHPGPGAVTEPWVEVVKDVVGEGKTGLQTINNMWNNLFSP